MNDAQAELYEPEQQAQARSQPLGCLQAGSLAFFAGWILVTTAMMQFLTWTLEQQVFESSKAADLRWLLALLYGLVILVPALGLLRTAQGGQPDVTTASPEQGALPAQNAAARSYRAFILAGLYVLFQVPTRLAGIDNSLEAAALQVLFGLLFLLLVRIGMPRAAVLTSARGLSPAGFTAPRGLLASLAWENPRRVVWRGVGVALLAALLVGIPWVLWGALGSVWDTLFNLLAALLFGSAAGLVLEHLFWREPGSGSDRAGNLLGRGLLAALALLVMVTGLAVNGNQGLLSWTVPPLGWLMAVLSRQGRLKNGATVTNRPVLSLMVGLAAFWPLAFIDPDELAVVIGWTLGEIIQWASLASFFSLVIGALLGLVFLLVRKSLLRPGSLLMRSPLALLPAGFVAGLALLLYFGVGQPGWHGERLYVILRDQADLSGAAQISDYNQRRAFVYRTLVDHANATQAGLRETLDNWGFAYRSYYLENAIEVQGGPLVRAWLESRPEVDRVLDSPILRPLPAEVPATEGTDEILPGTLWNLAEIQADRAWEEFGARGAGIIIGQSDSGVQYDHPEVSDGYRGRDGSHDYNWYDPWNHTAVPEDTGGHGTHTLGTALGNRVGVAPDAQWIGCANLARNLANPPLYLECMQFMLAPFPQGGDPLRDGRPELGAHVLNNSWGCPEVEGCDPTALVNAVNALRAAGIFVVASAGNDGSAGCATVAEPISLHDAVYSVGSINPLGELSSFSSKGPVSADGSGRVKPDIVAPGEGILSAYPGGTYQSISGTSMAGPHLAGVVALMWSANPALIGDVDRTEQILNETATPYSGGLPSCVEPGQPNNAAGYGVVNAYAAVRQALEQQGTLGE